MSSQEAMDRQRAAATEADADAESSSSGSDEVEADAFHFPSDAAADELRKEAVNRYNTGDYSGALDRQYRIVRYFSKKYGATAPESATYFLDYALSQLRVLQSQSSIEDALSPRDDEAMEACYVNLEVARVGLQKREDQLSSTAEGEQSQADRAAYVQTELMLAETHNALAQLLSEKEDYDGALKEYETELLTYRSLQADEAADDDNDAEHKDPHAASSQQQQQQRHATSAVPAGRVVSALYGIADCFIKEADFAGAEERLQATLDEAAKYPAGTIAPELLEELRDLLEDARDMKHGKYAAIRDEIDRQFVTEEAEKVPTAHEFYESRTAVVTDENGEERQNPYVSAVPGSATAHGAHGGAGGSEGSYLSMPTSACGAVLGLDRSHHAGGALNENSNSVSLFPPQQLSRGGAPRAGSRDTDGRVNVVVAKRKPKVPVGSRSLSVSATSAPTAPEPATKRARAE